ncbi:MAG TPA: DUF4465 domain-containing protein [Saprospiraceae bacterium]|nr:DUF4465 domain-containing protein [Saprospiraceae bacterium]
MNALLTSLFTLLLLTATQLSGQDTIGFESFGLPADTFLNQSAGHFASGPVSLPNSYDPTYGSWSGWAISTMRDTLTASYINQYSCIAGGGAQGSTHYAVAYHYGESIIRLNDTSGLGASIAGFWVNNTTYTYLSMRDGDAFSKRFGGETGEDPDYLRLTFRIYQDGTLSSDSLDFYLADYRFEDSESDYLVKDWTYVDLTSLGHADSVSIAMASSDVGIFGINTPTYFAVDDIVLIKEVSSRKNYPIRTLSIAPNPAYDWITILGSEEVNQPIRIFDLMGKEYLSGRVASHSRLLDVHALPSGIYILRQESPQGELVGKFIRL